MLSMVLGHVQIWSWVSMCCLQRLQRVVVSLLGLERNCSVANALWVVLILWACSLVCVASCELVLWIWGWIRLIVMG